MKEEIIAKKYEELKNTLRKYFTTKAKTEYSNNFDVMLDSKRKLNNIENKLKKLIEEKNETEK